MGGGPTKSNRRRLLALLGAALGASALPAAGQGQQAGKVYRIGLLVQPAGTFLVARRCASFVDRIVRGAKPGELPIEQPTNFELVLHAGRAKVIGLAIPPAMLIRADRVIE